MKNLKIRLRHVLSWPKGGQDLKFHESGIYGGLGKRQQTDSKDSFSDFLL